MVLNKNTNLKVIPAEYINWMPFSKWLQVTNLFELSG